MPQTHPSVPPANCDSGPTFLLMYDTLRFMYLPAVETLATGLRAVAATGSATPPCRRWQVLERGIQTAPLQVEQVAVSDPDGNATTIVVERQERLSHGDVFCWVGLKSVETVPWSLLKLAGVRTVHYQSEPLGKMWDWAVLDLFRPSKQPPPTPAGRIHRAGGVDEIWDHSQQNLETINELYRNSSERPPVLRLVPPGFMRSVQTAYDDAAARHARGAPARLRSSSRMNLSTSSAGGGGYTFVGDAKSVPPDPNPPPLAAASLPMAAHSSLASRQPRAYMLPPGGGARTGGAPRVG